ncbi:hypothetical protein [Solicola gregarius]|uniref:Sulfotransferase family protein n=1 Tax=Solicola gregarius TaxID=2908642 RepID=A0AA46YLS9_9ACTN|nr:hypothetical protein [Solicola gregarius]UYM06972.1 hypothetical protein L0C25_07820 [Solicola gregarius]
MTDSDDLAVPEGTRLVHIGPPKTGTTAIQLALFKRRADLREHGIVFPGKGYRPRAAGWAVIGAGVPRGRREQPTMADWQALVDEVAAAGDQRVVVSNESFADGYADAVQTIVDGLGGERIHVVHTVRRVDKLLSSHWQQRVQAGLTVPYDEWLRIALGEPNPENGHWRGFWRHHDLADVMDRWVSAAGADKVTLIIADESDHLLLPRLFERFLDLPAGYLRLPEDRANRSMSLNEIEMVRRLHALGKKAGWDADLFRQVMRFGVTETMMRRPRDPDDSRIELPAWAAERSAELNQERADIVRSLGVRVIGDPETLCATPSAREAEDLPEVRISTDTAAEAIAAAIDAGERRLASSESAAAKRAVKAERASDAHGPRTVAGTTSRELLAEVRSRVVRRVRRK